MLTEEARQELQRQQYIIVGDHSCVKICGWTKNMIRGKGGCYKLKFYGIMSHQCLQCSTSISCANRCTFCWRSYKAPVQKEWKWNVDEPGLVLKGLLLGQRKLLTGFGGSESAVKKMYEESKTVRHAALSLTGEPITYPRINELIRLMHTQKISTFLVTNAQYPEAIETLVPVTQLYLSIDAPTPDLLKEVDKPAFPDYWERMNASLDALAKKKHRTAVRLTAVKGVNMCNPSEYAALIRRGNPDFIEVKAYMFVGYSRQRLKQENMPEHDEVKEFGLSLLSYLPDYEYVHEHVPSRVIMLAKKTLKKKTWIDFEKFFTLATQESECTTKGYLKAAPWREFQEDVSEEELE